MARGGDEDEEGGGAFVAPLREWSAKAEDLRAFAARAHLGDSYIYARGPDSNVPAKIGAVARELHAEGKGRITLIRKWVGGGVHFMAQGRLPVPQMRPTLHLPARCAADVERLDELMTMLKIAAARCDWCPTNAEIAQNLGLKSEGMARRLMLQAEDDGLIVVQPGGPTERRVIQVVATGMWTRRNEPGVRK